MPLEEVVFYHRTEDGKIIKYTLSGEHFKFILMTRLSWRMFYAYLNTNAEVEVLEEK